MNRCTVLLWVGALLNLLPSAALAQLVAVDDTFAVPVLQQLVVEQPGVLDNDTYDDEPAVDGGATAELVSGPVFGTLRCGSDPRFELCPDGSFNYMPDAAFPGSDSFTYRVVVGTEIEQAMATLTACDEGPTIFMCWKEAEFLAKLSELGYDSFQEGFENDVAWGAARFPFTAPSVLSHGIAWQSNHPTAPAENEITTGSGPARTGLWGVFDPEHGYATGTADQCDIDNPPEHCLHKDGFTGTRQPGESTLHAAGGYFTGTALPKLVMILDGGAPINLGGAGNGFQFYGVIDTSGFQTFRIEEVDGKVGQARYVFADDFTFGISTASIFADGFESGATGEWSTTVP
jgi:hypothetical protein